MTSLVVERAVRNADGTVNLCVGGQPGLWTFGLEMSHLLTGAWMAIAELKSTSQFVETLRVYFEFNNRNLEGVFEVEYVDNKGKKARENVHRVELRTLRTPSDADIIMNVLHEAIWKKLSGMVADMTEEVRQAKLAVEELDPQ